VADLSFAVSYGRRLSVRHQLEVLQDGSPWSSSESSSSVIGIDWSVKSSGLPEERRLEEKTDIIIEGEDTNHEKVLLPLTMSWCPGVGLVLREPSAAAPGAIRCRSGAPVPITDADIKGYSSSPKAETKPKAKYPVRHNHRNRRDLPFSDNETGLTMSVVTRSPETDCLQLHLDAPSPASSASISCRPARDR